MTHLSRSTIQLALNSLREHGFIEWESGGRTKKRGKYGQPLSNDYKLNIPRKIEKNGSGDSLKVMHSYRQPDITMTDSKTLQ
jgi:predicted transcriptional regulator